MDNTSVSHDDILDVSEMADRLENAINEVLDDQETNLAFSALVSATVNCIIGQAETIEQAILYKTIFNQALDYGIKSIKIKD